MQLDTEVTFIDILTLSKIYIVYYLITFSYIIAMFYINTCLARRYFIDRSPAATVPGILHCGLDVSTLHNTNYA
jgi:hypothetical protein